MVCLSFIYSHEKIMLRWYKHVFVTIDNDRDILTPSTLQFWEVHMAIIQSSIFNCE